MIKRTTTFVEQMDEWVICGLQAGARDFNSLLRKLPGVYPAEVVDSLRRVLESRDVSEPARAILVEAQSVDFASRGWHAASALPIPHPLDYDWRFTQQAVEELLRNFGGRQTDLVCLGTPTVFAAAIERFGPERVVLFDRNTTVLSWLASVSEGARAVEFDVFVDSVPVIDSDFVVADPPWYLEHIKAFLWVATKISRVGGRVLISVPPHGTRPTIAAELEEVFEYAQRLGLVLKQRKDGFLPYETPPFEANALRAAGCNMLGTSWRRGTLCIFQRVTNAELERPQFCCPTVGWLEADLYGTRFRFRRRDRARIDFDDPTLISLLPGDILPSVSRRHRLREHADVWSSGNRVFRCYGSHILHQIVELLSRRTSPDAIPRSLEMPPLARLGARQVERAALQIQEVAAVERFERRFIGRG